MGTSYREIYVHIVFSTRDRKAILYNDLERFVHRRFREIALKNGLQPLAINSAWDHIHLLIAWNTSTTFADVVRELKGRTYNEWNGEEDEREPYLRWQKGYGIFSIRRGEVDRLKRYIFKQKWHHREDSMIHRYERF